MDITEWLVVLGGIAAIAWVNWYFFFAERSMPADRSQQPEDGR